MATAASPERSPRHRAGNPQTVSPPMPEPLPVTRTTMPTAPTLSKPQVVHQATASQPSLGELVKDASTHVSTLVRGEIELAKTELTGSLKKGVQGAVFFGAAAVVLAYSLVFLLIALAEGLVQVGLYRWLSYLIVWFLLILIAAVAGLLGWQRVKRMRKPERTIETLRDSKDLLHRGHVTSTS